MERLAKFRTANNIITITNGNNAAATFLNNLQAQRESQRTTLEELKLALANVDAAMEARERSLNAGTVPSATPAKPAENA